ncbi:MAG: lysoplasmalogenase [Blastomonas sp.]
MVVKRALVESRPWLLLSLLASIGYFLANRAATPLPDAALIAWKGSCVALLAVYALVRHHSIDGRLIAIVMAFGALGDVLIELDFRLGALAFIAGHVVAIWLYMRNRRERLAASQRLLAMIMIPALTFIAWALPFEREGANGIALYTLFLATMAAAAWTSRFPRYRVGFGALLFVFSDLLIFARMGPLEESILPALLIWPTYYFGQFLICTGVVQTLRHKDPRVAS